jgi:hypothetical protein
MYDLDEIDALVIEVGNHIKDREVLSRVRDGLNQLRQSAEHARSCCCRDGTMLVDDSQFTSGFDRDPREERFPGIGKTVCNVCHGANVMVSLNERQRSRIERMREEYDMLKHDYEILERMYEKALEE